MTDNIDRVPFSGFLPDDRAAPLSAMKVVADLGDDGKWYELSTQQEANRASLLTETAIHIYFAREFEEEGGHPRRWFVLVGSESRGDVCLYVTPPAAVVECPWPSADGTHTIGFRNKNPYPDYGPRVDALAQAIGIDITPNWMGHPIGPEPTGKRP